MRKKTSQKRTRGGTETEPGSELRPEGKTTLIPQLHAATVASQPLIQLSRQARLAGMGDPATLVESATPPVVTAVPTVIAGQMEGEESLRPGPTDQKAEEDEGVWRSLCGPRCVVAERWIKGGL